MVMDPLQLEIKQYLDEREWKNFRPADLAKSVSIEAAELLEAFQWTNPTTEELVADTELSIKVRREIADIFIYGIELCLLLNVDFRDVVKEKLDLVRKKYPVEAVKGKSGNYYSIKQQYRREGKN